MNELDINDIALLYKTLVVLPVDRTPDSDKDAIKIKSLTPSKEDTLETKETDITAAEPENTSTESLKIEDAATPLPKHPFIIITTADLKAKYLETNSPFIKILDALQVPHLSKYIITEDHQPLDASSYEAIWAIGLNLDSVNNLNLNNHRLVIVSPDILSLQTNEEKKAMYLPVKAFISTNMGLISQL